MIQEPDYEILLLVTRQSGGKRECESGQSWFELSLLRMK